MLSGNGVYNHQAKQLRKAEQKNLKLEYRLPAVHGPFYLQLLNQEVSLHLAEDDRLLAKLTKLGNLWHPEQSTRSNQYQTTDSKTDVDPQANLVLQINEPDQLVVTEANPYKLLSEQTEKYLLIDSVAHPHVPAGEEYQYQIQALSNAKQLSYQLDSAPPGMAISPTGLLTWKTTIESPQSNSVLLKVSTADGQEKYHNFTLNVQRSAANVIAHAQQQSTKTEPVIKVQPLPMTEQFREVKLPSSISEVICGADGRILFLKLAEQKKFAAFDLMAGQVVKYLNYSEDDALFAAGATHAFIFEPTAKQVTRYRIDTWAKEVTAPIPHSEKLVFAKIGVNATNYAFLRFQEVNSHVVDRCEFLDLQTLKLLELPNVYQNEATFRRREYYEGYASRDGLSYIQYGEARFNILRNMVERKFTQVYPEIFPMSDGFGSFNQELQYYNHNPKPNARPTDGEKFKYVLPAVHGPLFLNFDTEVHYPDDKVIMYPRIPVYFYGNPQPLLYLGYQIAEKACE